MIRAARGYRAMKEMTVPINLDTPIPRLKAAPSRGRGRDIFVFLGGVLGLATALALLSIAPARKAVPPAGQTAQPNQ